MPLQLVFHVQFYTKIDLNMFKYKIEKRPFTPLNILCIHEIWCTV